MSESSWNFPKACPFPKKGTRWDARPIDLFRSSMYAGEPTGKSISTCARLRHRSGHELEAGIRPEGPREVRLRVRTNSGVKVLIGQKHWSVRSGRQLGRRETGWRAAGSERPVHKQDNDELDSA